MNRSTVRSVLNKLLLVLLIAAAVTGFIVDQLDLNDFRLHAWAGYAMTVAAALHVGAYWSGSGRTGLVGRWRRSPGHAADPAKTTPSPDPAAEPHEPHPEEPAGVAHRVSRRTALTSLAAGVGGAALGWYSRDATVSDPFTGGDVGLFYHHQSSLGVAGLIDALVSWGSRPSQYKEVDGAGAVPLPTITTPPTMTLATAVANRRSLREYADRPMTSMELAWLVRATTGITNDAGFRAAPSAGALYPIETYVAVDRVDGVDPGLYHVDVREQALEPIRDGSVAGDVMLAGLGQGFLRDAPAVFAFTGLFQRTRWKYHERHYRYVCWEAGHMAQNLCLAAESAGLGACVVGAFWDGRLNDLLDIDGRDEAALGLIAVGPR